MLEQTEKHRDTGQSWIVLKRIIIILLVLCFQVVSEAQTYYWVGGNGSWGDTLMWSLSSGGTNHPSSPPGPDNNVIFDGNSFLALNDTVFITDANSQECVCKTMSWQASSASLEPILKGAHDLHIYGSLQLIPFEDGENYQYLGLIYFKASTSGNTIKTHSLRFRNHIYFRGDGGEWNLLDSLVVDNHIYLHEGTLNTNNFAVECDRFFSDYQAERTLNMGSSNFYIRKGWDPCWFIDYSELMTLNAGTSTIIFTHTMNGEMLAGHGLRYNDVVFESHYLYGQLEATSDTFNNVSFTDASCGARIYGDNNVFTNVYIEDETEIEGRNNQVLDSIFFGHDITIEEGSNSFKRSFWRRYQTDQTTPTTMTLEADSTQSFLDGIEMLCDIDCEFTRITSTQTNKNAVLFSDSVMTLNFMEIENITATNTYDPSGSGTHPDTAYNSLLTGTVNWVNPDAFIPMHIDSLLITDVSPCYNDSNGVLNIYASGGLGNIEFSLDSNDWQPSPVFTDLKKGPVSIFLREIRASGQICSSEHAMDTLISGPDSLIINNITTDSAICHSECSGRMIFEITGGTLPYDISLNGGTSWATGDTLENICPGSYSNILIRDINGCPYDGPAIGTQTIQQPAETIISFNAQNLFCHNDSSGNITANASGTHPPFSYSWVNVLDPSDTISTGNTAPYLAAGTYKVITYDAYGCLKTQNQSITQPDTLNIGFSTTAINCFGDSTATLTATASGGTAPFSHYWSGGQSQLNTNPSVLLNQPAGIYTDSITDANGCSFKKNYEITQPTDLEIIFDTIAHLDCYGAQDGFIKASASGGTPLDPPLNPYILNWQPGGESTDSIFDKAAGEYIFIVTDKKGCQKPDTATITQNPEIEVDFNIFHPVCHGDSTGYIKANISGGFPGIETPYHLEWTKYGSTEIISRSDSVFHLTAGTYELKITDSLSCTKFETIEIIAPPKLQINFLLGTDNCSGTSGNWIKAIGQGGTPYENLSREPYDYLWLPPLSSTEDSVYNLSQGTYHIMITDSLGCTATDSARVAPFDGSLEYSDILCNGAANGWAKVNPVGGSTPYTFAWKKEPAPDIIGTNDSIINLDPGTYTVIVTDNNNCLYYDTVYITQPTALSLSFTSSPASCYDSTDGTATAIVGGGTPFASPAYRYSWSNGDTTASITTAAGRYYLTATDSLGCTISDSVEIIQPDSISINSLTGSNLTCYNYNDGQIEISASGGTGTINYTLQPAAQSNQSGTFSMLNPGGYFVQINDANGCLKNSDSLFILNPDTLHIDSAHKTDILCHNQSNGSMITFGGGGTTPLTYTLWDPDSVTSNSNGLFNNIPEGTYSITLSDANDCPQAQWGTISILNPPAIEVLWDTISPLSCHNANDGSISLMATGGIGALTYTLNPGNISSDTGYFANLSGGSYNIRISDQNACLLDTNNIEVINPDTITFLVDINDVSCYNAADGSFEIHALGGTRPFMYSINNGNSWQTDSVFNILDTGTYALMVRDTNYCLSYSGIAQTRTITQPDSLTIAFSNIIHPTCAGCSDGSITANVSGGTASYQHFWSNGMTGATISGLTAGCYTDSVVDQHGCSTTKEICISEPPEFELTIDSANVRCFGQSNAWIKALLTGGTKPYTYEWKKLPGAAIIGTDSLITGLDSATYQLTVWDFYGYSLQRNIYISQPDQIQISLSHIDSLCPEEHIGWIKADVNGGNPPFNYSWQWSAGDTLSGHPDSVFNLQAGTYSLTIQDDSLCQGIASATIFSYPSPVSNFTVAPVCFGDSSSFTSISSAIGSTIGSYHWNFNDPAAGDDSISALMNPKHLFTSPGNWQTEHYVIDQRGCSSDTTNKSVNVYALPEADFSWDSVCNGNEVPFTDLSSQGSGNISNWNWSFGDGNNSFIQNPSHLYGNYGNYNVQLSISDIYGCKDSIEHQIRVYSNPIADFIALNPCAGSQVQFTDLSDSVADPITHWLWDFDDGTYTSLQNPIHVYGGIGNYEVSLRVSNQIGCADSIMDTIEVWPSFWADFKFDTVCFGQPTQFRDTLLSTDIVPESWFWDFGDGATSTEQNPSHIFSSPGTFSVVHTVTDTNGCIATKTHLVGIYPLPQPAFSASTECLGDSTTFINQSELNASGIQDLLWQFGDGGTSSLENPRHLYLSSGYYNVVLNITNSNGCFGSDTAEVLVSPLPTAGFTADTACLGFPTHFTDQSSGSIGSITNWEWDFGDGSSSSSQNPNHTFATAGVHNVQLIILNNNACSDTIIKTVYVAPLPVPDFIFDTVCLYETTHFTDQSTALGGINTWLWDFGNGNFSNDQNPSFSFNIPGNNPVSLQLVDNLGCIAGITKDVLVYQLPVSNFSFGSNICLSDSVAFTDLSLPQADSIISWSWDFGDGSTSNGQNPKHKYASAGSYFVRLAITNNHLCSDTLIQEIIMNEMPVTGFSADTACLGSPTQFMDQSSTTSGSLNYWYWDFGDGNASGDQNPAHIFNSPGIHSVRLISGNNFGCNDTLEKNIFVRPLPLSSFLFSEVCLGDSTEFTDQSGSPNGAVISWMWNFGDGNSSNTQNTRHLYTTSGIYNVSLTVTDAAGCAKDTTNPIEVYPLPIADFAYTVNCINDSTSFSDLSSGNGSAISSWFWDFGDGSTSTEQNPKHVFSSAGIFNVQLIIINGNNCSDSIQKPINIYPLPDAGFEYSLACAGDSTHFNDTSHSAYGEIIWRSWDFGDPASGSNNTSSLQNPWHKFSSAGIFTVRLIIENTQGCRDTLSKEVTVLPRPHPDFGFNNDCLGDTIFFIDQSSANPGNNITQWMWQFGDGNTSAQQNPWHIYADHGNYTVRLSIQENTGCIADTTKVVQVWPLPVADFTYYSGCINEVTHFIDQSSGSGWDITDWHWNFGDPASGAANTSTLQNPGHTFSLSGEYLVSLTVSNSNGCQASVQYAISIDNGPIADFLTDTICQDFPAYFDNLSYSTVDPIVSWYWNFGDGDTSTLQYPYHTYAGYGTHYVSLSVETANGCHADTIKEIFVTPLPDVDFNWAQNGCSGDSIQFYDLSSFIAPNAVNIRLWDFGDGATSTEKNPKHAYAVPGPYTVTLAITDTSGCYNSLQKEITIKEGPNASFSHDVVLCNEAHFTNLSNDNQYDIINWYWNFGDPSSSSNTSTLENPTHIYDNTGSYSVRLIVENELLCRDTVYNTINISKPVAGFMASSNTSCPQNPIQFTDTSLTMGQTIISWLWDFGDGLTSTLSNPAHAFDNQGNYTVKLIITTDQNCTDSTTAIISILPSPQADFISTSFVCQGDTSWFEDASFSITGADITNWHWEFGDGGTSNLQNPWHIYNAGGSYSAYLQISDENGCTADTSKSIEVHLPPQSSFSYQIFNCDSAQFTDLSIASSSPIDFWLWNFGDPASGTSNISTEQNPHHYYYAAGTYNVTLITENEAGCSDTSVLSIEISHPQADFTQTAPSYCPDVPVQFSSTSVGTAIVSWYWEFGDGQSATSGNPLHAYTDAGIYQVSLSITNASGCQSQVVHQVEIHGKPVAAFSNNSPVCLGDSIYFDDLSSSVGNGLITQWQWDFGDGSTSGDPEPAHLYSNDGYYTVALQVTNEHQCFDITDKIVEIQALPTADFNHSIYGCDTVQFTDLSQSFGYAITDWEWDFGDPDSGPMNFSDEQNPFHLYTEAGTYSVQLIVSTAVGCRDTINQEISIDEKPVAGFTVDQDSLCAGLQMQFTDTSSISTGSISSWLWSFGDGTTSTEQSPQHAFEEPGMYFVTLTVTGSNGCTDNEIQPVFVSPGVFAAFDHSNLLCAEQEVSFYDGSSSIWQGDITEWLWDFGDGSTSNEQDPVHTYLNAGNYQVSLRVTNSFGCIDDSLRTISINDQPQANFSTETINCDTTWFTDLSSDPNTNITTWQWDFDDPSSGWHNHSTESNPYHVYYVPGTYSPSLTVTNETGCSSMTTKSVTVNRPVADFSSNSPCQGQQSNFTDNSWSPGGAIVSWLWDFGDGNSSTDRNPSHTYASAGTYYVRLTVTNNLGCLSHIVIAHHVKYPPTADFQMSGNFGCLNETIQFTDLSYATGGSIDIIAWYWDFGDGGYSLEQNPSHTYIIPSNYVVTLVVYDGEGCFSQTTKNVIISQYPQANFTHQTLNCDTTWFTDLSNGMGSDIIYWDWNFDDPISGAFNTSTEENPWHIFTETGTYNVQLVATNASGCSDSISLPVFFDAAPAVGFYSDTVCLGNPTQLNDTSPAANLIYWSWDFGSGHSSTQQNPSFTFLQHGLNPVSLTVTNEIGCSSTFTANVMVDTLPEANFDMSDTTCLLHEVHFTNLSIPHAASITDFLWNFGDGATSTEENPSHTYTSPVTYFVNLSVSNSNGCQNSLQKPIFANPDPVANFTFDTVCLGLPTNFVDLSSSQYSYVTYWEWHFGDGSDTLGIKNPPHVYPDSGNYTVQLIIADMWGCSDTISKEIRVHPLPIADFSISNESTCKGDTIFFQDESTPTGAPLAAWNWYFGHPSSGSNDSSQLQNPWHVYDSAAVYYSLLIVTDSNGCRDDILKPVEIHPLPNANFTYSSQCVTDSVSFTDLSSANQSQLEEWLWDFGDGTTSGEQNPKHLYTAGLLNYTVNLTVTDTNGCSKSISQDIALIPLPEANFSYSMNVPCSGEFTEFFDESQANEGIITSWQWDFDDGSSSTIPNPVHYYPLSGNYNVQLIVRNSGGCYDTTIQTVVIHDAPLVDFTYDTVCFGDTTQFIDTIFTSGAIIERKWEFGDGQITYGKNPLHHYNFADTFDVRLTVTDTNGCINYMAHPVIVRPAPAVDFEYNTACFGNATNFHGINNGTTTSWFWTFGDGNTSTAQDTNYIYESPGVYKVTLTASDINGCKATIEKYIAVLDIPKANFTWDNTWCDDGFVQFHDSSWHSSAIINKWQWQLDSNYFSIWQNPDYVYDITDTCYDVKLIVTDNKGCSDSVTKTVCVAAGFHIDFDFENACPGDSALFRGISLAEEDPAVLWQWKIGQQTIETQNDSLWFVFEESGPVEIKLKAWDSEGCVDSLVRIINVYKKPIAQFEATTAACTDSTHFTDLSIANADDINSWTWNFGDTNSGIWNTSALQNPSHLYPQGDSLYLVHLHVSNSNGCTDTASMMVRHLPCFRLDFSISSEYHCAEEEIYFIDQTIIGSQAIEIISYKWDFDDGNTLSYNEHRDSVQHQWLVPGNYTILFTVTALMEGDVFHDTITKALTISPDPVSRFTFADVCAGDSTHFTNESFISEGEIKYRIWDFMNGEYLTDENPVYFFPEAGTYPVSLISISETGCRDTMTQEIEIHTLPTVELKLKPPFACGDSSVIEIIDEGSINSGSISQRIFSFGDGTSVSTMQDTVNHIYNTGSYIVKLESISEAGCSSFDSTDIRIFEPPVAVISHQPDSASGLDPLIEFNPYSSLEGDGAITSWFWDFGDHEKVWEMEPVHRYSDTGYYKVILRIGDENQCQSSDSSIVHIYPELSFYIANAFSPNGDGVNATFGPHALFVEDKSYEFLIFNRWGAVVFQTNDPQGKWDGSVNGDPCPSNLYVWTINLEDNNGVKEVYKGTVMLLR